MLFAIYKGHQDYKDGQESIVHLVSSMSKAIATGRPWAFTDRHAELGYAGYFEDTEHLDRVDWKAMRLRYWREFKEVRQAEFLVHDYFPWSCIDRIVVHNPQTASQVKEIIRSAKHKPAVAVNSGWYY